MRYPVLPLAGILLAVARPAGAAPELSYSRVPDWVVPPPAPTDAPTPEGAPMRIVYADNQVRVAPGGMEEHVAWRFRILQPEALAAGNLSVQWHPDTGAAAVHHVRIIRDGRTINVLEQGRFRVLQREERLEQSMLSGELTAVLQVPGLRVGDELEFATTITRRDPIVGDKPFGFMALPPQAAPGAFRARLAWPSGQAPRWRVSADLPRVVPGARGATEDLRIELRDPGSALPVEGAPPRFNLRRLIEYSAFADWEQVSARFEPLSMPPRPR